MISSPLITLVAEIINWNVLRTEKIRCMGKWDKIWILVPVTEWRVDPLTYTHCQQSLSCLFFEIQSHQKEKKWVIWLTVLDLYLGCFLPSLYVSIQTSTLEPWTWVSVYSVSLLGCPSVTWKLNKLNKPKFTLSSLYSQTWPLSIVSFPCEWHHFHKVEM